MKVTGLGSLSGSRHDQSSADADPSSSQWREISVHMDHTDKGQAAAKLSYCNAYSI